MRKKKVPFWPQNRADWWETIQVWACVFIMFAGLIFLAFIVMGAPGW